MLNIKKIFIVLLLYVSYGIFSKVVLSQTKIGSIEKENTITLQELQRLNSEKKPVNQMILGIWQNVFKEIDSGNSLVGLAFIGTGRSNEGSLTTITQGASCKSIFYSQERYKIRKNSSTEFYTAMDIDKGFTTIRTIFRIERESEKRYLYIQLVDLEEERPKMFDENVTKLVMMPDINACKTVN